MVGLLATAGTAFVLLQHVPVAGQPPAPGQLVAAQEGLRPRGGDPALRGGDPAMAKPTDPQVQAALDDEIAARHAVAKLVESYRHSGNEKERMELKSQIAKELGEEFLSQQKRRSLELDRVEAQLKKVRDLLRKRSEERQTIIDKRLDQLVREAEGLGWSDPSGFPNK
jgi:hypothetical protein